MLEKTKTRLAWAIGGPLCLLAAGPAQANTPLWSVLDRVPRGVNFLAIDVSWGEGVNNTKTRLTGWGVEEQGAMYMFRDEFVWGMYAYSGMVYSKIRRGDYCHPDWGCPTGNVGGDTRIQPNPANLMASYVATRNKINALGEDACGANKYNRNCAEWMKVGGNAASSGRQCLMPDNPPAGCAADMAFIQKLFTGTLLLPPSLKLPKFAGSSSAAGACSAPNCLIPPGPPGGGILKPLPPPLPAAQPPGSPWLASAPYIQYRNQADPMVHSYTATVCSINAVEFYPDHVSRGPVSNAASFAALPNPPHPTVPAGTDPFGTVYVTGCPCPNAPSGGSAGDCMNPTHRANGMARCPVFNPYYEIAHELQGFYYQYPRFPDTDGDGISDPDPSTVNSEFCNQWGLGFTKLNDKRLACSSHPDHLMNDPSPSGSLNPNDNHYFCQASQLSVELCNASISAFAQTCMCQPTALGCEAAGASQPSPCGALDHPNFNPSARQYVAICHADRNLGTDTAPGAPRDIFTVAPLSNESATVNPDVAHCRPSYLNFVTTAAGAENVSWAAVFPFVPESYKNRTYYRRYGFLGAGAYAPAFDSLAYGVPESDVWDSDGGGNGQDMKEYLRAETTGGFTGSPRYVPNAIDLTSNPVEQLRNKLAIDLQKAVHGVYTGGAVGLSRIQDRAAVIVVEAPGTMDASLSATAGNSKCEKGEQDISPADCNIGYFGRPARLETYSIAAAGTTLVPRWQTDRTGFALGANPECYAPSHNGLGTWGPPMAGTLCNSSRVTPQLGTPVNTAGGAMVAGYWYGPAGPGDLTRPVFKTFVASKLDRNGDGFVANAPDGVVPVRWGPHFGGESTKPVFVEAPPADFIGKDTKNYATWRGYAALVDTNLRKIKNRPRMIYTLSEGYLIAYMGGRAGASTVWDGVTVQNSYTDTFGALPTYTTAGKTWNVGAEVFRYRPAFLANDNNDSGVDVDGRPKYLWNDLKPGNGILGGEIVVRDIEFSPTTLAADQKFGTVLVFSQGRSGRGFAAMDISEPDRMNSSVKRGTDRFLWEYVLPSGEATSRPNIYHLPDAASAARPAVVIVGGLGNPTMYSLNAQTGAVIDSIALPGGEFRGEVACVDALGYGRVTHCYSLSTTGSVVRVELNRPAGTFKVGSPLVIYTGTGTFSSSLVAFFTSDNSVGIAFGSGDASRAALERTPAGTNRIYKVVDPIGKLGSNTTTTQVGTATNQACNFDNAGGFDTGVITLPAGYAVITTPAVAKGAVAFSVYAPPGNACTPGNTRMVAFDFENCQDLLAAPGSAPAPVVAGAGMPSTPVLLRRGEGFVSFTSENPQSAVVKSAAGRTRGGGSREMIVPVFKRDNSPAN
ncbi:MAG: hypothetical protein HYV07_11725 [Deltaproteobacteria bacterium]|nr:hypothetical protein [Deltaproteobacteria bacterium]